MTRYTFSLPAFISLKSTSSREYVHILAVAHCMPPHCLPTVSEPKVPANGTANVEVELAASGALSAPHPFDSPHADVILQSSDGKKFRARKAILAEASSVFQSMFSLPAEQPPDGVALPGSSSDAQDLPIVPMSEDSGTLEGTLRLCYPPDGPLRKLSLDIISRLFPVIRKYALDRAEAYVVETLHSMAETAPLRVYCLSIQYELDEDLTRAAARAFLDESVNDVHTYSDAELDCISASAYIRLLDYHRRCATAARKAVARYFDEDTKVADRCWTSCINNRDRNVVYCTSSEIRDVQGVQRRIVQWFLNLMSYCVRLVEDRPSGRMITFDPATVQTALTDAWKCANCKKRAWDDVQEFLALIKAGIDQAILQVSIKAVVFLQNPH